MEIDRSPLKISRVAKQLELDRDHRIKRNVDDPDVQFGGIGAPAESEGYTAWRGKHSSGKV